MKSNFSKAEWVQTVFSSVAKRYDLMNDMMSLGLHRYWRQLAIKAAGYKLKHIVLDVACGTGRWAQQVSGYIGKSGELYLVDFNQAMLDQAKAHLYDHGMLSPYHLILADVEKLPFQKEMFDIISINYGLRNFKNKIKALTEVFRTLKIGGKLIILELTAPKQKQLAQGHRLYTETVLPKLGSWILQDSESYDYLASSIQHLENNTILKQWMKKIGFQNITITPLTGGVATLYEAYRL